VVVTVEGHGREEWAWPGGDVTRTVGWFTSLFPVAVEARGGGGAAGCVRAAKEALRAAPGAGVGYGMLRWLSEDESVRRRLERAGESVASLNYLGRVGGAAWGESEGVGEGEGRWAVAGRVGGEESSGRRVRRPEVEATARVEAGRLRLGWRYARGRQDAARMREVLGWWVEELEAVAAEWRAGALPEPSAADFPLAKLTNAQLGKVLSRIGKGGK
jgi:non-ribosomal peptide synthase protein (TIGR01720 family)